MANAMTNIAAMASKNLTVKRERKARPVPSSISGRNMQHRTRPKAGRRRPQRVTVFPASGALNFGVRANGVLSFLLGFHFFLRHTTRHAW